MDSEGLAFPYLRAILETGLGVRLMPVGLALFDRPPWNSVSQVFTSTLKARFINVVCVPPGLSMGAPVSAAQFGNQAAEGAAYKPDTAISGLYTVGVPNVVIVDGEADISDKELESLCLYSRVLCPTQGGTSALCKQGVPAATVAPAPGPLSGVFSGITPA